MSESHMEVKRWQQLSLLNDECYELTLKVGLIPSEEHVQFQFEVTDPRTGELIELESRWHCHTNDYGPSLGQFVRLLSDAIADRSGPF